MAADAQVGVKQAADADRDIDNEDRGTSPNGRQLVRQRVAATGADGTPLATDESIAGVNGLLANRYEGLKIPVTGLLTTAGDHTLWTPSTGNAVRLFWVTALNDPAWAGATPIIGVSIGALDCYLAYAVSHWEVFEGGAGDPLVVNLSSVGSVAVTAHIQEFSP